MREQQRALKVVLDMLKCQALVVNSGTGGQLIEVPKLCRKQELNYDQKQQVGDLKQRSFQESVLDAGNLKTWTDSSFMQSVIHLLLFFFFGGFQGTFAPHLGPSSNMSFKTDWCIFKTGMVFKTQTQLSMNSQLVLESAISPGMVVVTVWGLQQNWALYTTVPPNKELGNSFYRSI